MNPDQPTRRTAAPTPARVPASAPTKGAFVIGRILFGGFFLLNGLRHFLELEGMTAYAASKGVPLPEVAVIASGVLIILGGTSLVLGLWPRIGALLVVLFLVPVTLMMHAFWAIDDPQQRATELGNFLKNAALLGAALMALIIRLPWPASVQAREAPGTTAPVRRPAEHRGPA